MTNENIQSVLESRMLPLDFWQKINHFALPNLILFLPFFIGVFSIYHWYYGIVTPVNKVHLVALFVVLPLVISIVSYFTQKRAMLFKSIATTLSSEEIKSVIKSVASELEWEIETFDANFIQARTHPPFSSGSWGEMITIVIGVGEVLVNSICDPGKQTSVISFGRNKQNMRTFLDRIGQIEAESRTRPKLSDNQVGIIDGESQSQRDSVPIKR